MRHDKLTLATYIGPVTIRDAGDDDARNVAQVHVRSWQVAYQGLLDDEFLANLSVAERAARYQFDGSRNSPRARVIHDEGVIRGLCIFGVSRDHDRSDYGEIEAIYVDPDYWGKGYGHALMRDACDELHQRGYVNALLWVLEGNARAEAFYLREGWQRDGATRIDQRPDRVLREFRMVRSLRDFLG